MFRFISSKKYKEMQDLHKTLGDLEARYDALNYEIMTCEDKINEQEAELARLRSLESSFTSEESNYVKLVFSNDLQKITPIIGLRQDCFESLFQEGLLKDDQEENIHAIQLALMTIAGEGLSQILEAFEEEPKE